MQPSIVSGLNILTHYYEDCITEAGDRPKARNEHSLLIEKVFCCVITKAGGVKRKSVDVPIILCHKPIDILCKEDSNHFTVI